MNTPSQQEGVQSLQGLFPEPSLITSLSLVRGQVETINNKLRLGGPARRLEFASLTNVWLTGHPSGCSWQDPTIVEPQMTGSETTSYQAYQAYYPYLCNFTPIFPGVLSSSDIQILEV